jgi:hypothetical protein
MLKNLAENALKNFENGYDSFMRWVDETVEDAEVHEDPTDADLAMAFRELGALRRQNAALKDTIEAQRQWTATAKEQAGYDQNVSFDTVFDDLLSFYKNEAGL